jgi:hypothetical protein
MSEQLKHFVRRVLALDSAYDDIGARLPLGISGATSAGSDTLQRLHLAAISFAREYKDGDSSVESLAKRAKEVEGLLMASVTLGALTEGDGVRLLDELQALLELKVPQLDAMPDGV